jgi:hypothetical protein
MPAMSVAEKIIALVEALQRNPEAFEGMAPERRRVLRETCRYVAMLADPDKPGPPKAGVLDDLKGGRQG